MASGELKSCLARLLLYRTTVSDQEVSLSDKRKRRNRSMIENPRVSDAWSKRLSLLALLSALLIVLISASVAHALDTIDDTNLVRGSYRFQGKARDLANIINHRMIFAALPARAALDSGTATALLETIRLSSGEELQTVDLSGDGLIRFAVDAATAREALGPEGHLVAPVENKGRIPVDGKEVKLTAKTVRKMLSRVVNTSGVMVARALVKNRDVARLIGDDEKPAATTATGPADWRDQQPISAL